MANLEARRNMTAMVVRIPQDIKVKYPIAWLPPGSSKFGITPGGGSSAGPSRIAVKSDIYP